MYRRAMLGYHVLSYTSHSKKKTRQRRWVQNGIMKKRLGTYWVTTIGSNYGCFGLWKDKTNAIHSFYGCEKKYIAYKLNSRIIHDFKLMESRNDNVRFG